MVLGSHVRIVKIHLKPKYSSAKTMETLLTHEIFKIVSFPFDDAATNDSF